jgi:hypothetical protein
MNCANDAMMSEYALMQRRHLFARTTNEVCRGRPWTRSAVRNVNVEAGWKRGRGKVVVVAIEVAARRMFSRLNPLSC